MHRLDKTCILQWLEFTEICVVSNAGDARKATCQIRSHSVPGQDSRLSCAAKPQGYMKYKNAFIQAHVLEQLRLP
jgi:hypothetical protein